MQLPPGAVGVFADDALHAQQPGVDVMAAHGVDVGMAPVAAEAGTKVAASARSSAIPATFRLKLALRTSADIGR